MSPATDRQTESISFVPASAMADNNDCASIWHSASNATVEVRSGGCFHQEIKYSWFMCSRFCPVSPRVGTRKCEVIPLMNTCPNILSLKAYKTYHYGNGVVCGHVNIGWRLDSLILLLFYATYPDCKWRGHYGPQSRWADQCVWEAVPHASIMLKHYLCRPMWWLRLNRQLTGLL